MKNTKSKPTFERTTNGPGESEWFVTLGEENLGEIVTHYSWGSVVGSYREAYTVEGYEVTNFRSDDVAPMAFTAAKYGTARKALAAAKNYFRSL